MASDIVEEEPPITLKTYPCRFRYRQEGSYLGNGLHSLLRRLVRSGIIGFKRKKTTLTALLESFECLYEVPYIYARNCLYFYDIL